MSIGASYLEHSARVSVNGATTPNTAVLMTRVGHMVHSIQRKTLKSLAVGAALVLTPSFLADPHRRRR